jgi:SAM-dependent methyltransferase
MPNWLLKSAVHRVISWLPQRQFWNGLLQTYVSKSTRLSDGFLRARLTDCQRHLEVFFELRPGAKSFRALEIGTGWFPVLPVGFYLCGAQEIWTIDIEPLLSAERLAAMLEMLCEFERTGELQRLLPRLQPERMNELRKVLAQAGTRDPVSTLEAIHIHALVGEAQKTNLPPGTIDFFFSNGVLHYIPRPVLQSIMREWHRLAAPGAVFSHRLNLRDQYAYFDKRITVFNFLQFTESEWHRWDSPLTSQIRYRVSDFRDLFAEAGLEIVREENISGAVEDLKKVKLAPEFRSYKEADLLVVETLMAGRLPAEKP